MLQLKNKQNVNTNPIISRQDCHLTQPYPPEEKQTKTQHKSHKTYINLWNLGGQKPKGRKNSILKPGKRRSQHNTFKQNNERQRNTTQMKEQTRNIEVQKNEEEIGKQPEK